MADYSLDEIKFMARDQGSLALDLSVRRSMVSVDEFAKKLIDYHKSPSETARRDLIKKRRAIVEDRWQAYLISEIENTVTPTVASAIMGARDRRVDITRNIARDIWREMTSLYRKPPSRSLEPKSDDALLKYQTLLAGTNFDLFWMRVEFALKAYNDVIVYPHVVEHYGQKILRHRMIVGDQVTVLSHPNDPMIPEAILIEDCYKNLDGKEVVQFHIVTNFFKETYDIDGNRITAPEGFDPESPYHFAAPSMPFVAIHANPFAVSFFDPTTGADIVDLTVDVGYDSTMQRYQRRMSSFKQVIITGSSIAPSVEHIRDTLAFIKIEAESASTQIVDWTIDHQAYQQMIDSREARAAASRGINPEKLKTAQSNYITIASARISERGLLEARQENVPIFVEAEKQYYRLLCTLAKAYGMDAPDPSLTLLVKHADLEYPEDPQALFSLRKNEASMGLLSLASLVLEKHPDWTEDQAKQFIVDNISFNATIADIKVQRSIPDDLTNRSLSDEQAGTLGPLVRDEGKLNE